jgi:formiminotetrahydrofolate cyclodeaminase
VTDDLVGPTAAADDLLDLPVDDLLDALARDDPGPGSGSVAALVAAMAAALTGKAARRSRGRWADAGGAAAQAHALRLRAAPLAITDARVYGEAIDLLERAAELDPRDRDRVLGDALERAAEIPLRIAAIAADVAALARDVADRGSPEGHGEAVGAAVLAKGAADAAAHLVAINLGARADDERVEAARLLAEAAANEARAALGQ